MNEKIWTLLRLESIWFGESNLYWWKNPEYLRKVFGCLDKSGLWFDFPYYKKNFGKRFYAMPAIENLLEEFTSWKPSEYVFVPDRTESPASKLTLLLNPISLDLRFKVEEPHLSSYGDSLIDRFIHFTQCINHALDGITLIGPRLGVEIFELSYPRVRPHRTGGGIWTLGNVVNFASRKFHAQHELGLPEDLEKILKTPMPAGATRLDDDDLVVLRWADNLLSEEKLAQSCSIQEQWLTKCLNLPVDSSYNTLGDHREAPLALDEHPPLTLYSSMYGTGYKAIVLDPDGSYDEPLFAEMAGWIEAGKLPDGTLLNRLRLILPNRDSVFQIEKAAKAIGVEMILYADNDGNWWNPLLPGDWIDIPYPV